MQILTRDDTKIWTVDDYLSMGELSTPCQLINGELIMSPSPTPYHQIVLGNLYDVFKKEVRQTNGLVLFAPVDLYVDKRNVLQSDLLFLSDRKHLTKRGIEGPPDLIVEIISPSNSYTDRYEKKESYLKFGVREFWIVDPANKTLEIYYTTNWDKPQLYLAGDGLVVSNVLPGLSFDLKTIF